MKMTKRKRDSSMFNATNYPQNVGKQSLQHFISEAVSCAGQGKNGTIPINAAAQQKLQNADDEQLLLEINQMQKIEEISEKIDKFSQFLTRHWENSLRRFNAFSKRMPNDEVYRHFAQLSHQAVFIQCLFTRARCLMQRNWDGDLWDSVRDCLVVLRLNSMNKLAHFLLIKCLVALKQLPLATECFTCYRNLYHHDEQTTELEQLLLDEKPHEKGSKRNNDEKLLTLEYANRHSDYLQRYTGHLNINTDIKESNWFGPDDQFIVAGSDCGSMFIWERKSQCIVKAFKGDHYTVNCCQPHPFRCLIASSGIDDVIRFWEPASTGLKKATEEGFPEEAEERNISELYELTKRNRRVRTPELVWEQLLNSVGLGLFHVDSTREEDEGDREENEGEEGTEDTHVIRCRQM